MNAYWYLLNYFLSLLLSRYRDFPYVHMSADSLGWLHVVIKTSQHVFFITNNITGQPGAEFCNRTAAG